MTFTRSLLLLVIAVVCFAFALIVALGAHIAGSTYAEWIAGGLLAWSAAGLP